VGAAAWPRRGLVALVRGYRFFLSPWLGSACRFEPSCSRYAIEALERHGALQGSALAAGRLLRCHPWCQGGLDPVPDALRAGLFTRLARRHDPKHRPLAAGFPLDAPSAATLAEAPRETLP
jgi:putative membrane protein insertion efficiency factor